MVFCKKTGICSIRSLNILATNAPNVDQYFYPFFFGGGGSPLT